MRGRRQERGSVSLELAIVAPVILALGAVVLFAARVESAHQLVEQAAQDAARAASQARSAPAARAAAQAMARQDLAGHLTCQPMQLSVGGEFAPGASVTTTVSCTTGLGVLPGHLTTTATGASVVDVLRGIAGEFGNSEGPTGSNPSVGVGHDGR